MKNFLYLCTRYQTLQGIMSTAKVTLINKRDGKERYTRHEMSDVVEMIRTGKLKSGKLIDELTERPLVCFSSMLMTKGAYQWADVYNGCVLLEINSLPDRQTAEEIRDEARFIPYTVIAFVGADGRSVKIVSQAAERDMWQNPDGYELKDVEQFHEELDPQLIDIVSDPFLKDGDQETAISLRCQGWFQDLFVVSVYDGNELDPSGLKIP